MEIKEALIRTLREEVKPAIGCTEPVAIALAVARAKEASGIRKLADITAIEVRLSGNVYKNTMGVGIPGTKLAGIDVAVALGAAACRSEDGLTVFSRVCEEGISEALGLIRRGVVRATAVKAESSMYVDAVVKGVSGAGAPAGEFSSGESSNGSKSSCAGESPNGESMNGETQFGRAVIIGKHDRFIRVENNDGVLFEDEFVATASVKHDLDGYTVGEIIRGIETLPYEEIAFLKEGVEMNLRIAEYGLENECGLKVGKKLKESGDFSDCYMKNAMMLTAAAADARMDGAPLPVMSSSGSGNNGLTSIIPVAVYCRNHGIDDETLCRAVAISHITNTIIKQKIGRLSALCGCAISAGSGAAAALSWLKGGTVEQVEGTIQNMIANTSGMICDGAKTGCALKLATSVSAAFMSSTLAMDGICVPVGNGIIGKEADNSIANLGIFADATKESMDESILEIMQRTAEEERGNVCKSKNRN